MANLLTGFTALYQGLARQVFQWPSVIAAKKADDTFVILHADDNGALKVTALETVTPTFVAVGANASGTIPAGVKGWTITFLTGSGTLGTVPVSAGFSDSDENTTDEAIAYTTNSASSAYLRYNI